MVDVCIVTYNHVSYIEQAIKSVLSQKTNFSFRIIIGDDFSTDGTRDILRRFEKQYPGIVIPILRNENIGVMRNFTDVLLKSDATYLAILDGDDYWIDDYKLQKQVDFMNQRTDISFCFHDAEFFICKYSSNNVNQYKGRDSYLFSEKFDYILSNGPREFTQTEILLKGWFIPTASILLRRSMMNLPGWFSSVYSGDTTLHLLMTNVGNAYYMPDLMSRYRLHSGSIANTQNKIIALRKGLIEKEYFKLITKNKNHLHLDILINQLYYKLSQEYLKAGKIECVVACLLRYYTHSIFILGKRVINKLRSVFTSESVNCF